MTKGKTLRKLDVKEGDVVECVTSDYKGYGLFTCVEVLSDDNRYSGEHKLTSKDFGEGIFNDNAGLWKIHSRAGEPKKWREMTPEEKGALLLSCHEGGIIEYLLFGEGRWAVTDEPSWSNYHAYRIQPEPEVKKVTLRGNNFGKWGFREDGHSGLDNYAITFDVVDGEPVLDSIGMHLL